MKAKEPEITALLISPDRELARQFQASSERNRAFQVISEIKAYPPQQTLEIRLRQFNPDVVLLDVASDLQTACDIIRVITSSSHSAHVVGLHARNDSDAILRSLRVGATEFLYAPFSDDAQREAVARLQRLIRPGPAVEAEPGSVMAFSSAKPGSGASTLASQTAFAIRRSTGKRILLADFDVMGGMIGFYLKLNHNRSALEALQQADQLNDSTWASLVASYEGVDILPAPETPYTGPIDPNRLHMFFEYARLNYDWIIADLPVVFQRLSLMAISESDRAFLVSTSELPSLHLARKAVNLLNQVGFPKERFQIMVNRVNKRDDIAISDIEKLFNCSVHSRFPNDYFSLHRVVTLGQPLGAEGELGAAIENVAMRLSGGAADKKGAGARGYKPALQQA